VILGRDRACPCPGLEADSHEGCPYDLRDADSGIPEVENAEQRLERLKSKA